jgi:hypothetical protein
MIYELLEPIAPCPSSTREIAGFEPAIALGQGIERFTSAAHCHSMRQPRAEKILPGCCFEGFVRAGELAAVAPHSTPVMILTTRKMTGAAMENDDG